MARKYIEKLKKISDYLRFEIDKVFKEIDKNTDHRLSVEECILYWENNFPLINTNKMVNDIDKNNDGVITYDEWFEFWELVLENNYSEEQIIEEV